MSPSALETAAPSVQAPDAAAPRPAPLASRIADTFFSPGRVFEQFRGEQAPWIGPVLVCIAVLVVLTAIRPLFISNQQVAEFALQKMGEMGSQNLPSVDEMAGRVTMQSLVGTVFVAAWMFLRVFLLGAILALIFGLMLGGRTAVRPYAAVASHAFLALALGNLVLTGLQYASGRLDIVLDGTLLMGDDPGPVLASVGHALYPFVLWATALLALGGATVNRRRGWLGPAALLFALLLALYVTFGMIGALMRGRAGG